MTSNSSQPQIAVWFFVGATFVFAAPLLFFPEAAWWARIVSLGVGFVLVVCGGIQLGRELRTRRPDLPKDDGDTPR